MPKIKYSRKKIAKKYSPEMVLLLGLQCIWHAPWWPRNSFFVLKFLWHFSRISVSSSFTSSFLLCLEGSPSSMSTITTQNDESNIDHFPPRTSSVRTALKHFLRFQTHNCNVYGFLSTYINVFKQLVQLFFNFHGFSSKLPIQNAL